MWKSNAALRGVVERHRCRLRATGQKQIKTTQKSVMRSKAIANGGKASTNLFKVILHR